MLGIYTWYGTALMTLIALPTEMTGVSGRNSLLGVIPPPVACTRNEARWKCVSWL